MSLGFSPSRPDGQQFGRSIDQVGDIALATRQAERRPPSHGSRRRPQLGTIPRDSPVDNADHEICHLGPAGQGSPRLRKASVATVGALNFSIVSGWFPFVLFWATITICVATLVLRRGVVMEFAVGIPLGLCFMAGLFLFLHFDQSVPTGAPQSLYLWLAAACLLAGLVLAGWHSAHWTRRFFGVVAIVLAVTSAGSSVNQTFQYYPTLDRLLGKNANHFLNNSALNSLRAEVARTGQLPDHGATLSVPIPATNLKYTPEPPMYGCLRRGSPRPTRSCR